MNTLLLPDVQDPLDQPGTCPMEVFLGMLLVLLWALGSLASAEDSTVVSKEQVAEHAKEVWDSGAIIPALEILDQGLLAHPDASVLHKLRGDILSTFRGSREAVRAYEVVLAKKPAALEVRWAKWSVLIRSGQAEEAIAELRRIAQYDRNNPLIHLRLALELRKLDRLEESLKAYVNAVELVPHMLSWRLALARARFDVLDYQGAEADLRYVLQEVPSGSPLELPAKNQLAQLYESMERGRRFTPVLTPGVTGPQLKEWAAIRAEGWELFWAGRYQEAESVYRKMLTLNPRDSVATRQLGLILMELGRCEEAITVFGKISDLNPSEEDFADTMYRMGQCLVKLERWEDAFLHFQILYDAAVEFEETNKHVAIPLGTRVLSKEKIARWLTKVRPHVPELAKLIDEKAKAGVISSSSSHSSELTEVERYIQAAEQVKPQRVLETGVTLMGRDADFSWFRFVIPASKVARDDFPTGAHEFVPLNPGDTFFTTQAEIYLVFGLVAASYDAVPLTVRCALETSEITADPVTIVQDQVLASTNDQSGYFMLPPQENGWTPGLYRCGLYAGERTSAYSHVDEVRFRIIHAPRVSS